MKTWRPNDLHLIRVVLQNLKQLLSNCKKIKKNQVLRHLTAALPFFPTLFNCHWQKLIDILRWMRTEKIKSNMFCALQHGHNSGHGWPYFRDLGAHQTYLHHAFWVFSRVSVPLSSWVSSVNSSYVMNLARKLIRFVKVSRSRWREIILNTPLPVLAKQLIT